MGKRTRRLARAVPSAVRRLRERLGLRAIFASEPIGNSTRGKNAPNHTVPHRAALLRHAQSSWTFPFAPLRSPALCTNAPDPPSVRSSCHHHPTPAVHVTHPKVLQRAAMVLINGRKFACEACIRGHRASSCAHTGRQLQLVRPKGRPSSQCEICRAKRANGSFHGRCDCNGRESSTARSSKVENGVETFTPYAGSSGSDSQEDSEESMTDPSTKGRHSLEALMNPCQCRTTGICSCCSRSAVATTGEQSDVIKTASVEQPASCGCNGGDRCCDDGIASANCDDATTSIEGVSNASCCATKRQAKPSTAASLPVFEVTSTDLMLEQTAMMSPDCHCGPDCSCPGCLNEGDGNKRKRFEQSEECPDKCSTCSACVLGLTRPSGIEAVDAWMEQEKEKERVADAQAHDNDRHEKRPRKEVSTKGEGRQRPLRPLQPALPPFPQAKSFFTQHFRDDARRQYFAQHMKSMISGEKVPAVNADLATPSSSSSSFNVAFGRRLSGESDEQWQARHGFSYLTPAAIEIFDQARKFREERRRAEEEEERQTADRPNAASVTSAELAELRKRALAARKSVTTVQS